MLKSLTCTSAVSSILSYRDLRHMAMDEKPPVFSSWKGWYAMLVLVLAMLIVVFYGLTQHYG